LLVNGATLWFVESEIKKLKIWSRENIWFSSIRSSLKARIFLLKRAQSIWWENM